MAILHPFPHYAGFTAYTPTLPTLYWDVYSSEQRLKALCMEYVKLVGFTDSIVDTVNDQYQIIETLQAQFPELVNEDVIAEITRLVETGTFNEYLREAAEAFLEAKTAQITANTEAIATLNGNVSEINEDIDGIETDIADLKESVETDIAELKESVETDINTLKETDIATLNENTKSNHFTHDTLNIYLSGTAGSDDNDGLTDETPVQTLAKAFEIVNRKASDNVSFRFIGNGRYVADGTNVISAGEFHFTASHVTTSVEIVFPERLSCYNAYIHFSATNANTLAIEFADGMHSDGCDWYFSNCAVNSPNLFEFYYGGIWLRDVKYISNKQIQMYSSRMQISGAFNQTIGSDSNTFIYAKNSQLAIYGSVALTANGTFTSYPIFSIEDSFFVFSPTSTTISSSTLFNSVLRAARSFCVMQGTGTDVLNARTSNKFDGNYSYIRNTFNNVVE